MFATPEGNLVYTEELTTSAQKTRFKATPTNSEAFTTKSNNQRKTGSLDWVLTSLIKGTK